MTSLNQLILYFNQDFSDFKITETNTRLSLSSNSSLTWSVEQDSANRKIWFETSLEDRIRLGERVMLNITFDTLSFISESGGLLQNQSLEVQMKQHRPIVQEPLLLGQLFGIGLILWVLIAAAVVVSIASAIVFKTSLGPLFSMIHSLQIIHLMSLCPLDFPDAIFLPLSSL